MNDDYAILKQKLNDSYNKNILNLNNFDNFKKSIMDLVNDNSNKTKSIDDVLKDRIVDQYECEKQLEDNSELKLEVKKTFFKGIKKLCRTRI